MQLRNFRAIGALGCLLILGVMVIVGTGCGSSGDTTAPPVEQAAAKRKGPSTPRTELERFMKRRFGSETWYPLIRHIRGANSGGSYVVVESKLTNHKTPAWNQKQAEVMCRAFVSSPTVKSASVFWDARTTYETFSCGTS